MDIDKIAQYLEGISYGEAERKASRAEGHPFITISRQAGCGGHILAEAILREMEKRSGEPLFRGWQIFDEELCRKVSGNPKLKVLMDGLLSERFKGGMEDVLTHVMAGVSYQDAVTREIFRVLRGAALLGKSILIGRGAASLLRRHSLGVSVRLVAPLEQRVAQWRQRTGLDKERARKIIERSDADRARFVRHYFGQDIDDPFLYDCLWNMGRVSVEALAGAIVGLVEERSRLSGGVLPGRSP